MRIEGTNKNDMNGGVKDFVEGKLLNPKKSWKMHNHSPNGFSWGYGGSGPAQLALALIIYGAEALYIPIMEAVAYYQNLKWEVVAMLPKGGFNVEFDLLGWIKNRLSQKAIN